MKKILGAAGGLGLLGVLGALFVIPVVMMLIIAAGVSTVGGGLGGMFGDDRLRNAYLCGQGVDVNGVDSSGTGVPTTASQKAYVRTVIGVAKTMKISKQGQVVSVMVMLQESGIRNYANDGGNARGYAIRTPPGTQWWLNTAKLSLQHPHDAVGRDADSVGLFQQRASAGWAGDLDWVRSNREAAIKRLLDPRWGAQKFFEALKRVNNWENKPPTVAAQSVQGSAFPSAYAKWESQATGWVNQNADAPAIALIGSSSSNDGGDSSGDAVAFPLPEGTYHVGSPFGYRIHPIFHTRRLHGGQDLGAPLNTPIMAIADGKVRAAGRSAGFGNWIVIDHNIDGKKYSSVYGHMYDNGVLVKVGDTVTKGQKIGKVGSNGWSTGPHLHIEIWESGRLDGGHRIDPMAFLKAHHSTSTTGGDATCNNDQLSASLTGVGSANAMLQAGVKMIGTPYSWGGGTLNGPGMGFGSGAGIRGFDCSSLVRYMAYQGTGKSLVLPRTSREQYQATKGNPVALKDLQPGDLIFWGSSPGSIHHVAMYYGDNKILEAGSTGTRIHVLYNNSSFRIYAATRLELKSK